MKILYSKLPNVKQFTIYKDYNHMDFGVARNAREKVYYNILRTLEIPQI